MGREVRLVLAAAEGASWLGAPKYRSKAFAAYDMTYSKQRVETSSEGRGISYLQQSSRIIARSPVRWLDNCTSHMGHFGSIAEGVSSSR